MTIDLIKNKIDKKIGDYVKIIYNGSRNRKEEYLGIITETYNYIFIVKMNDTEKKSFSYSDILTNTVQIFFNNI